ncbi:MAG: carboxylating nicotinate-nucleotide diphosphorylase [Acidobacteria bacterium]|nr:carboxylating nicotinate-nucleotide diphosphorylase [Acidobacteriota bacterium]
MSAWNHPEIVELVQRALAEDIGTGDLTSESTIDAARRATGRFYARQPMVLAGVELLPVIFDQQGGVDSLRLLKSSGDRCADGEPVAEVTGLARTLLRCERVSLNFMQRLSGIATLASRYVAETAGTPCKILDTRKTTPGLRRVEKLAAAAGGVTNHRLGLFDAILIKNNHITACGSVTEAVRRALATGREVECEVRTRAELDEALAAGAKRLLLDNLTPAEAHQWITHINGRASTELSGGITIETVRAYAQAGADFVSSGAITHSAVAVDLNFRIEFA